MNLEATIGLRRLRMELGLGAGGWVTGFWEVGVLGGWNRGMLECWEAGVLGDAISSGNCVFTGSISFREFLLRSMATQTQFTPNIASNFYDRLFSVEYYTATIIPCSVMRSL